MNKKFKRLMAYILMPLIFAFIGYFIIGIAAMPFYEIGYASLNLVLAEEQPTFLNSMSSIYTGTHSEIENKKDTLPILDLELPDYGVHYGQISCDRIDLSVQVYYGDDNEILRNGLGHYNGSFFPGFKGTTLVAGHNTTYLLPLQNIKKGDVVSYSTNYADYEYKVVDLKVLNHKDETAVDFAQRDTDMLVLYTCYPFTEVIGIRQERLFVYAEKISGPDIDEVYNAEE